MVEVNPPEFISGECYTFEDYRHAFSGVVCVEGVTSSDDLVVTAVGGASVNVNVGAGSAWVEGDLNGAAGVYYVENDASVAMTIGANGAGSSRIDRIIASVYDSQYIGAVNQWAIEVVQGVAGAGVPAVPDSTRSGWVELAQVTVPASGGTPSVVSDLAEVMVTCGRSQEAQPYVMLRATGVQSIPHAVNTKINLPNTVHLDEDFFSVSASEITILQDGVYDGNAQCDMDLGAGTVASYLYYEINTGVGPSSFMAFIDRYAGGLDVGDGYEDLTGMGIFLPEGTVIYLSQYQFQDVGTGPANTGGGAHLMVRKVG